MHVMSVRRVVDPGRARASRIAVGAALLVAAVLVPAPAQAHYTVGVGDTASSIAARHGVTTQALVAANGISNPDLIVAGTQLAIPGQDTPVTHVVRPGETLSGIATRYGISVQALAAANGIADPDRIYSGIPLAVRGPGDGAQQPAPTGGGGSPAGRSEVRQLIAVTAASYGWRSAVPLGLAMQESGWNNAVVSSAGAIGLFQVLPTTGEWVGTYLLNRSVDLTDPADNVAAGMAYLDYLYNRFDGNVEWALAAYFEGPGRTERAGGPSTPGAQRYVDNVLALSQRY